MNLTDKIKYTVASGSVILSSCVFLITEEQMERERQRNIDNLITEDQSTNNPFEERAEQDSMGNSPIVGSYGPIEGYIPGEVLELSSKNLSKFVSRGNRTVLTCLDDRLVKHNLVASHLKS